MPTTCPGRPVAAASVAIGIELVFDARMAPSGKTSSARRNSSCFTAASSTTASTMRSAGTSSPTAAMRASVSSGSAPPFAASFTRLACMVSRARSSASGDES